MSNFADCCCVQADSHSSSPSSTSAAGQGDHKDNNGTASDAEAARASNAAPTLGDVDRNNGSSSPKSELPWESHLGPSDAMGRLVNKGKGKQAVVTRAAEPGADVEVAEEAGAEAVAELQASGGLFAHGSFQFDSGNEKNVESGRGGDAPQGNRFSPSHFDDSLLSSDIIDEGLLDLEADRPNKSNEAGSTQSRPFSPIIASSHGTSQAQQAHLKLSRKRPREPEAVFLAGPGDTEVEEDRAHNYGKDEQRQQGGEEPQSEHPRDVRIAQRVKSSNIFDDSDGEDSTSLDNPACPRSGWDGFGADEVDRLVNSRWLNDQIITSVLRHLSAPVLEYVALTPYDVNSRQGHATVRSLLTRQSLNQGRVRYILAIVNQHDNHWVTLRLVLDNKTCELYDSLSVRVEQQPDARPLASGALEMLNSNLLPFLPPEDQMRDGWKLKPCTTCPQQENTADCGIFALLVASHLLSGLEVPATIDIASIALWRAIFAALGSPQSSRLADRLPEHLRDNLEDPQLTPQQQNHHRHKSQGEVEEEEDKADGSEPTQTAPKVFADVNAQLSGIDHKLQRLRDH